MNLVLDEVEEVMRGMSHPSPTPKAIADSQLHVADEDGNESTRTLGLVVARGTLLVLVSPVDGSEEISNPFAQEEEGDD